MDIGATSEIDASFSSTIAYMIELETAKENILLQVRIAKLVIISLQCRQY